MLSYDCIARSQRCECCFFHKDVYQWCKACPEFSQFTVRTLMWNKSIRNLSLAHDEALPGHIAKRCSCSRLCCQILLLTSHFVLQILWQMWHAEVCCAWAACRDLVLTQQICLWPHMHPPGPSQLCSSSGSFQQPGWLVYGVKGYWSLSNISEGGHLLQWFL